MHSILCLLHIHLVIAQSPLQLLFLKPRPRPWQRQWQPRGQTGRDWCFLVASLWQILNRSNILFAQLKLVTIKASVQSSLFCLHLVLIYVDNDARNVAMVCFLSVHMWNTDSHTVMHTDHLKLLLLLLLFPILARELQ